MGGFLAHKYVHSGCILKEADIEDWLWVDALNKECSSMSTSKLHNKNFMLSLFGVLCHVVQLEDKLFSLEGESNAVTFGVIVLFCVLSVSGSINRCVSLSFGNFCHFENILSRV